MTIDDLGSEVRVHFSAGEASFKGVVAMAVSFAAGAALLYPFLDQFSEYLFFYCFFGVAFVFLGFGALAFSGRSRLTFNDRCISFRQGHAPTERSIELRSIEEMISGWDALHLVGDATSLAIDWPESAEDRNFLKALVAYEIARRVAPV